MINNKEFLIYFTISKKSRDITENVVTETRIVPDTISYNQQLPK